MKTCRTISNISYNSLAHFEMQMRSIQARGVIEWAYWVYHLADTDETKDHIHFVLRPSARIETNDLRTYFNEVDPTHPDKPLTCTCKWNFTNSMDDWLLYAIHDINYLRAKGQTRNHHYEWSAIKATDYDALRSDINAIDMTKWNRLVIIEKAVRDGKPFFELVQDGVVPISQRAQYEQQYRAIFHNIMYNKGRRFVNHEVIDDEGNILLARDDNEAIAEEF